MSNEELEQPIDGEKPEEFVAPETASSKERTRESEIQANIEFWKNNGFEVDEADIREKIEALPDVEGMTFVHYLPTGLKPSDLAKHNWRRPNLRGSMAIKWQGHRVGAEKLDEMTMPRNTDQAYAFAMRSRGYPDNFSHVDINGELHSDNKTAVEWEKTGEKFTTPLEEMVAEARWYMESHKNQDHFWSKTFFPGSRTGDGGVPYMESSHRDPTSGSPDVVAVWDTAPDKLRKYYQSEEIMPFGVRHVITAETKTEK